jgi:hypothetical protein
MTIRKLTAATAAAGLLAFAVPVATAAAASVPPAGQSQAPPAPVLTFLPPSVGPICVAIGPIVIGGKVISPGVHVCTSGAALPPLHLDLPLTSAGS